MRRLTCGGATGGGAKGGGAKGAAGAPESPGVTASSGSSTRIRPFDPADTETVVALWHTRGLTRP